MCECSQGASQSGCCETSGSCCGKSQKSCSYESGCEMTDMVFQLANEAWAELLKEKMKEEYEKTMGDHLQKLAETGVEGCMKHWQAKMQSMKECEAFKQKVNDTMSSS